MRIFAGVLCEEGVKRQWGRAFTHVLTHNTFLHYGRLCCKQLRTCRAIPDREGVSEPCVSKALHGFVKFQNRLPR